MKSKTIKGVLVFFQVIFLLVLCVSCGDRESRKQEAPEKPQAAETPAADERDAFMATTKQSLEEVSQDMNALKKQVQTYTAEKMDEFEMDMQALADKEQQAYTKLKQLPEKTGAVLDDAEADLTVMAEDIQRSYRTLYEKYTEQIMREYSAAIEAMKERSENMSDDAAQGFEMKMMEIADKEQQAYTKLKQLPEKTGQAWKDLKKELDTTIEELAELYNKVVADKPSERLP